MIGISKKELINFDPWQYDNQQDLLNAILKECRELDPWLPIEDAPKDRQILLFFSGDVNFKAISQYNEQTRQFSYEAFTNCRPKHWKDLPPDPENS